MTRIGRRWALGLVLGAGVVVAIALLTVRTTPAAIDALDARWTDVAPWLLAWRVGLFACLVACWGRLVTWVSQRLSLDTSCCEALLAWRWRGAGLLLLMDLVLVEDLVGKLARILS